MKHIDHLFCTVALGMFLAAAAHAQNSGITGACTWRIDGDTLYIEGSGAMEDYTPGSAPWYASRDHLYSLVIGDGVTAIGDYAFEGCSGFTGNLSLPEGVTSIGVGAFRNCSSFTGSLNIPVGVTSIGSGAFSDCNGLTGISVDAGNTAYSAVDGVLFNKTGTVLVACPAGKTGAVDIPVTVTSIGDNAFSGCSGLIGSLTLPAGVTSIGDYVFAGCSGFTGSLTLPAGLTSIGDVAFYECSGFTGSLTLPAGLTSIGVDAFWSCGGFTGSLNIPAGLTSIGDGAFSECNGLTGISVDAGNTA
ncbi:MAG: leucine-rich repeat domain-containing protein, partial [Bacteroidales bacterium]|nr:leucine-rich repeat domain-containing protein [Bacteroidales bacterium]